MTTDALRFQTPPMTYETFLERIGSLFLRLARNPGFARAYPWCGQAAMGLEKALSGAEESRVEEEVVRYYCLLHSADVRYGPDELERLQAMGGYWCYAGGLEPLYRAGGFLPERSCSADLGAGNGLQGLLLQYLYPHCCTTQVELSGTMVRCGKRLRQWMGLPEEKFEWIHGDIIEISPERFDFIYMYLPVRPVGAGRQLYRKLARALESSNRPLVLFSIADCFQPFAPPVLQVFHSDGHLTCYTNYAPTREMG